MRRRGPVGIGARKIFLEDHARGDEDKTIGTGGKTPYGGIGAYQVGLGWDWTYALQYKFD